MLADFLEPAGKVIGLDNNEEFLAAARSRLLDSNHNKRIEFVKGNTERLPFTEQAFDWAYICG